MTTEQKIIRAKVGLLELAEQLGNVSQAYEVMLQPRQLQLQDADRGGQFVNSLTRLSPLNERKTDGSQRQHAPPGACPLLRRVTAVTRLPIAEILP